MLQVIEKVNHFIQPILWGWPVLICILLAGILFTVRLRFFQFTKIGLWMKLTFAGMFRRKKQSNDGISPFQALTTALAGSIGTGNIVVRMLESVRELLQQLQRVVQVLYFGCGFQPYWE